MTAQTLTLTTFLLDRIAEDTSVAERPANHWVRCPTSHVSCTCTGSLGRRNRRRLAEVAAKRAIVELHHDRTPPDMVAEYIEDCEPWTPECAECSCYGDCRVELPCPTLRALASVYADHELYRAEWEL